MVDGIAGRAVVFTWNGLTVKGVREKGITLNGEAINVTSDEDAGWRTLLDVSAEDSIDVSLSGVTKDDILANAYMTGQRRAPVTLTYPNGRMISFDGYLANYAETAPYNNAVTFTGTIQSSGLPTFVAAP